MSVKKQPDLLNVQPDPKRLLSLTEAMVYLGLGKSSTISYLESIGAKCKIGRRTLYDKRVIDSVLNNKEEERHE